MDSDPFPVYNVFDRERGSRSMVYTYGGKHGTTAAAVTGDYVLEIITTQHTGAHDAKSSFAGIRSCYQCIIYTHTTGDCRAIDVWSWRIDHHTRYIGR